MTTMLSSGTAVTIESDGERVVARELLGSGGQGEVWRADFRDRQVALKWYHRGSATDTQREVLQTLIDRGAPDGRFLWPKRLVECEDVAGFGYVMPLRPDRFVGIPALLSGRVDPTFQALARAGGLLADSFLALHTQGLSYCDISHGNVFLEPDSGDVLICDNDNVVVDGSDEMAVGGTPAYMAPEIVRGEALPSSDTDRHSLAVLLFEMFMIGHPLEGQRTHRIRCMDAPARLKVFGEEPVFCFDPNDASNRPVEGAHDTVRDYWELYPGFLKRRFVKAFTEGLSDPRHGRVRESQWRKTFSRLLDSVVECRCGAGSFFDLEAYRRRNGRADTCWSCGRRLTLPPRMKIGDSVVCLSEGTELFTQHLAAERSYDFDNALARVERNGEGRLGLRNLGEHPWRVTQEGVGAQTVVPERAIVLKDGFEVDFGPRKGVVRR